MYTSNLQIPINTRTIGTPAGTHILYIEDYVHTFIQKYFEDSKFATKIALFGSCRHRTVQAGGEEINIIVSGACADAGHLSKDRETGNLFFPESEYLGTARVTKTEEGNLCLELAVEGEKLSFRDYYIYYDQNEEMQNYLIAWNATRKNSGHNRRSVGFDAAGYGKIIQAYNKEEAKVSDIWNFVKILCLSFMLGILVYSVITINSYYKMQSLQSGIDYCMKMIESQLVEGETFGDLESDDSLEPDVNNETEISKLEMSDFESETDEMESVAVAGTATSQYYIVQQGDTLRNICYEIYGSYDYVEKICLWNDIDDPNNILCGQKLLLLEK